MKKLALLMGVYPNFLNNLIFTKVVARIRCAHQNKRMHNNACIVETFYCNIVKSSVMLACLLTISRRRYTQT